MTSNQEAGGSSPSGCAGKTPYTRGSLYLSPMYGGGDHRVNALDGVSLHVDTGEFVQRFHQRRKQYIRMSLLEHNRRTDF